MALPVEGAVRPAKIKHGDMWWESIDSILSSHRSIDGGGPKSWETLLESKRCDGHYEDVVLSIEERGFVRPLTALIRNGGQDFEFGDGHHRLAAAIDLGLTMVPIEAFDDNRPGYFGGAVANDSGNWTSFDDPIPDDNSEAGSGGYDDDADYYEDDDEEYDDPFAEAEEQQDVEPCNCYYCRNMK